MTIHPISVIEKLNGAFGIAGLAKFEAGQGGLTRVAIATPLAEAHIYLHGAHVTHFQPRGEKPVLWVSGSSAFEDGKPIRGGVPICFPWFGGRAGDAASPAHGFVRLRDWKVRSLRALPGGEVELVLALDWSPRTKEMWPGAFEISHTVTVGRQLTMSLHVVNHGQSPMPFEEALHTYFTVGDVRKASVTGLGGVTYIDKVDAMARKTQSAEPITISGETDRVYLATESATAVRDPVMGRRITIEKSGSKTTVVWNPWIEKAKKMADFGDEEWPGMICVETANAGEGSLTLPPGGSHTMTAVIGVAKQ